MIEELYQLDLFKDPEISRLEAKLSSTQDSLTRVRKGMFARLNSLQKMYDDIHEEHKIFKRNICRGHYEKEEIHS